MTLHGYTYQISMSFYDQMLTIASFGKLQFQAVFHRDKRDFDYLYGNIVSVRT